MLGRDRDRLGGGKEFRANGKGCDIGYALATGSCEGTRSVEARTVTAPDVITAFAVPNPSYPSQSSWFFQVRVLNELPRRAAHPAYFAWLILFEPTFRPSTVPTLNTCLQNVNAIFRCKQELVIRLKSVVQIAERVCLVAGARELSLFSTAICTDKFPTTEVANPRLSSSATNTSL